MLVNFFIEKEGEKVRVDHKEQLFPVANPTVKMVDGKPSIRVTESYNCFMEGAQAAKVAKAIGLNKGWHKNGVWTLSRSKYKRAIRYVNSKSFQNRLDKQVEMQYTLAKKYKVVEKWKTKQRKSKSV